MNKEAKAIVDYLEEEREAIRTLCYYPDDVLSCEDLILLMDYINQLETNRDEAIEYIQKHFEEEYKKPREELKKYNLKNCTYDSGLVVLGILERGKENEKIY